MKLRNAYRSRRILIGNLDGIEWIKGGGPIAVDYYKELRVVIPLEEIMINLMVEAAAHDYGELVQQQNKILNNIQGCEIDFIIKSLDNASHSVVASRKDAMQKAAYLLRAQRKRHLPRRKGPYCVGESYYCCRKGSPGGELWR